MTKYIKKQVYSKPKLVSFGQVRTLTQQGTGGSADGAMFMRGR